MEGQLMMDTIPGEVSFITVFRGRPTLYEAVTPEELAVLAVTKTGEVFGKGYNSLVTCPFGTVVPMKEGAGDVLEHFERLEVFQGLKVKKICVGESFGLALTFDNNLFKWGFCWGVPGQAVVSLEEYRAGPCHCGRVSGGRSSLVGGAKLMYCTHTGRHYKAYTDANPPPPGVPTKRFVWHDRASLVCPKCNIAACTPSEIIYDGYRLSYCSSCIHYAQPHEADHVHLKIAIKAGLDFCDVDVVGEYIWLLRDDRKSLLVTKHDWTEYADLPLEMSPGETVESIHCGQQHVAALMNKGHVYCYGNRGSKSARDLGMVDNLGSMWKADLPGRVQKVNCGRFATICLMEDGSLNMIDMIGQEGVVSKLSNDYTFPTVSAKPLLDIVFKLKYVFLGERGNKVRSRVGEYEDILSSLSSMLGRTHVADAVPKGASASAPPVRPPNLEYGGSLPENLRALFGKTLLSDLTLKLADGDFPAHSEVLFVTSAYFRRILSYDNTPSTLDMTHYNPRAYRCLLQHLYQVKPDALNLDDLLDLLDIAVCYKETSVVDNVIHSLKSELNPETVLKIMSRTKSLASADLLEACKPHIQSPICKAQIAEILVDDISKFIHLLPDS